MLKMLPIPPYPKPKDNKTVNHCIFSPTDQYTGLFSSKCNQEAHILNWRRNIPMFMLRLESNREICKRDKGYEEKCTKGHFAVLQKVPEILVEVKVKGHGLHVHAIKAYFTIKALKTLTSSELSCGDRDRSSVDLRLRVPFLSRGLLSFCPNSSSRE